MQGSVKIVYRNGNADAIISAAGRISTTQGTADEIYAKSRDNDREKNNKLIEKILLSGHTSVLEHANFNLSFDDVSVFVEQFIIEFRLASFTVKSRRYVDFSGMGFYKPDLPSGELEDAYNKHMEYLFNEYSYFLEKGVPKEDARFVLPYSFRSNFYCTINARELVHIVNEMINGRGAKYPELKALGRMLAKQCKEEMPFLPIDEYETDTCADIAENFKEYIHEDADCEDSALVTLMYATEDPCGKICEAFALYHQLSGLDIDNPECREKVIKTVLNQSRRRELEQVSATVRFNNVSLAGLTHLVRHRMQSLVIPELIDVCDYSKYVVPKSVVDCGEEARYREVFKKSAELNKKLADGGVSRYDRVYTLLSGMTIPVMTTMNANELFIFFKLRACNRAQWEIREDADCLLSILRKKSPELFKHFGPSCFVSGKCPEGRMTCGKINEVKDKYSKLGLD